MLIKELKVGKKRINVWIYIQLRSDSKRRNIGSTSNHKILFFAPKQQKITKQPTEIRHGYQEGTEDKPVSIKALAQWIGRY